MANLITKDGAGSTKELKAKGVGSSGDPLITYHAVVDGDDQALGSKADAPATTATTDPWSIISLLKGILGKLLGSISVTGTFWQATQPVSGTVTSNAGTNLNTSLLALEAGGNLATLVAKDYATQTTLALIKAKTDNIDVLLSTRTKPADNQNVTGALTVNAGTDLNTSLLALEGGGNLAALVAKDYATQTTLAAIKTKTDNIDVALSTRTKPSDTQTISGTVTANAGTNLNTSLLALEAGGNLASLVAKDYATQTTLALIKAKTDNIDVLLSTRTKPADTQIISGTVTATVSGTVTSNAGTNLNTSLLALEAGGNLATLVAKDYATQTTLALIKAKTDNIDVALSTRTKPADTQTISGTVTANAGTNLNTSLLALEAGGNLASLNGKVTACNTGAVVLAAGSATVGKVDVNSNAYKSAPVVTRPANVTAYTAGDVLGGAFEFTLIGPSAGYVLISTVDLRIDISAVPAGMTSFRLYLYDVTPPSAIVDNAAWDLPSGDRASYLGYLDIGSPVDLGSTLYIQVNNPGMQVKLASTSIFAYLVTIGGFTPNANSEVYTPRLQTVGL